MIDTFVEVLLSVYSLVLTCLKNDHNSICLKCSVCDNIFIKNICWNLSFLSENISKCKTKDALNLMRHSAELISCLSRSKKFATNDIKLGSNADNHFHLSCFGNLVHCLGFALLKMCEVHCEKCEQLAVTKYSLVLALQQLSMIQTMRTLFASVLPEIRKETDKGTSCNSNGTTVGILFFICVNPLELSPIRKASFRTISNALLMSGDNSVSNMEHTQKIADEIQENGGIDVLVETNLHEDCPEIRSCAAFLLNRLLSRHKGLNLTDRQVNSLFVALVDCFTERQLESAPSKTVLADLLSSLLNIVSRKSHQIQWHDQGIASFIVKLLPSPHKDLGGVITAASVCLPPKKPKPESVAGILMSSQTFLANLLKLLISYTDADVDYGPLLVKEGAIESLICLLANSSRKDKVVTKNAATALAKLSRLKNPLAMKRCRELRGMEILIALHQSNRI